MQVIVLKKQHKQNILQNMCEKSCVIKLSNPHLPKTNNTVHPIKHQRYACLWYLQHERKSWAEAQQAQTYLTNIVQYIQ